MEYCCVDKHEDLIGQQDKIIPYMMSVREKKLSYNSICTRLNAIYHFYDMNDISLNKKKIKMFKGEYSRKIIDKAYTHQDIKKTLDVSDLRSKIIESRMDEIITKIKKTDSIFELDPLDSELRILNWILYQVCNNERKVT
jgi:hypothetical protein